MLGFDFIVDLMKNALTLFYNWTAAAGLPSYGLAIIILTVAIKIVLYPLTVKQVKSMKAMQELAPKQKALQEKYKNDKEKLTMEINKLFKESGVNPLAGCLPLLIQFPFLIAMFWAIRDYTYTGNPGFLWIANLAQGSSIQDPSDPYFIIPALAAFTTYISSKQTSTEMTQQNKAMLTMMPLFIGYLTITFPAGLGVYWVVSNLVQIVQQWWVTRTSALQEGAR